MDIDSRMRQRGEFPTDRPIEALKTDHAYARELFDSYFQAKDAGDRRDLGNHLLALLEMHAELEENAFYPRVRALDPSLVTHFEEEHGEARQLIDTLKAMDADDPQSEPLFRRLAGAIGKHVDAEEQQLFPKIEQANFDMDALGKEMQAYEIRLIAARNQRPAAPGVRL